MEKDREKALERLNTLKLKYGENAKEIYEANEAKTRLLIIDELLIILGWAKEDFNPEEVTQRGQYIDYLLKINDSPRLIIEAKRIGNTFSPLKKKLHKNIYSLSYIKSSFGQPFADVLKQAQNYAYETRMPYGVLTNGTEWALITLIPPPGKDISDLKCFYFGNVFSEHHNFDLLWELLSKTAVENGNMEEELNIANPLEADTNIIPGNYLSDLRWKHNTYKAEYLNEFYDRFFGEIVDPSRRNMLTHCFVTSSKIEQYQGQLKRFLVDVAPKYVDNPEEITPGEHHKVLVYGSGDQKGRVIIITGSVGAGKTTFITKARIENRDNKTIKFVYLNLIDEGVCEEIDNDASIWSLATEQWKECEPDAQSYESLKQTFHGEIEALKTGAKSKLYAIDGRTYIEDEASELQKLSCDNQKFLERSWKYYRKNRHIQILLILDNVDRTSESYQRYAYSFAHKISSLTGANVILTMREGTFYRGKESGFLDVRSDDLVFHLQAPDITKIISRRIKYIEEHLDDDFRWKAWRKDGEESEFVEAIGAYTSVIKNSLLQSNDSVRLCEILAATAWQNIRKFMGLLKRIHKFLGVGRDKWEIQDVINALVIPSEFDLDTPITPNLFKPIIANQRSYYLKLRCLIYLWHGLNSSESHQGVKFSKLLLFLRVYGYREAWIWKSVEEMVRERLIECMELPNEESFTKDYIFNEKNTFRVSPLGVLLSEKISSDPSYLISVGWTLPFYDNNYANNFISKVKSVPVIPSEISTDDIEELIEVGLYEVVMEYLTDAMKFEEIKYKNVESLSEYVAVEKYIRRITVDFDIEDISGEELSKAQDDIQLTFDMPGFVHEVEKIQPKIDIPDKIFEAKFKGSSSFPKILWALVHLRSCGKYGATGSEITRIINSHLLDDQHQVEPTNISRALRSPVVREQSWLISEKSFRGRSTIFSLGTGWEDIWEQLFLSSAPKLQ